MKIHTKQNEVNILTEITSYSAMFDFNLNKDTSFLSKLFGAHSITFQFSEQTF